MTQLSDTQLVILSKAAKHPSRLALPLPTHLKGGAAKIVVGSLIKRGLLEEVDAKIRSGEAVWRETGLGHGVTLKITDAGLSAIGIEPEPVKKSKDAPKPAATKAPTKAPKAATKTAKPKAAPAAPTKKSARPAPSAVSAPREGTKQATMIAMLQRKSGATIVEIAEETGWQQHTVRGAFAGALKKKLGLNVVSEKDEKRGRVYRID